MKTETIAIVAALGLVTLWAMLTQASTDTGETDYSTDPENTDSTPDGASITDEITDMVRTTLNAWRPPEKYAATIVRAEMRHGIPKDMLARLLFQECRWRNDIITGRLKSPAGAVGIAQFMPATAAEWGIDPLNVDQAIDGAGRYLASLFKKFGTWSQALAAYNWGQGNVARRGLAAAPTETRNYYTQILGDVNAANGTAYA